MTHANPVVSDFPFQWHISAVCQNLHGQIDVFVAPFFFSIPAKVLCRARHSHAVHETSKHSVWYFRISGLSAILPAIAYRRGRSLVRKRSAPPSRKNCHSSRTHRHPPTPYLWYAIELPEQAAALRAAEAHADLDLAAPRCNFMSIAYREKCPASSPGQLNQNRRLLGLRRSAL